MSDSKRIKLSAERERASTRIRVFRVCQIVSHLLQANCDLSNASLISAKLEEADLTGALLTGG